MKYEYLLMGKGLWRGTDIVTAENRFQGDMGPPQNACSKGLQWPAAPSIEHVI